MYSFFNTLQNVNQGVSNPPEWNYVGDGLRRNLSKVVNTYRNTTMTVRSDHFLARILQAIAVSKDLPLDRYYQHVDAMAMNLATSLKMTSPAFEGQIFDGVFYGTGVDEILIATDARFDPNVVHRDWKNAQSVKVLSHPRSDLGFNLPDGKNTGTEYGIAVLLINIPMLAIQYRAFRLNEIAVKGPDESQRSIMNFIHMYVLPNMLFTQLDYALFNRFRNLVFGIPMGESTKDHPFYITDFSKRCDQVQREMLKTIRTHNYTFSNMLRSIKGAVVQDMEKLLLLPKMSPTRQVIWALTCARLPAIDMLFRLNNESPGNPNQAEINQVRRESMQLALSNVIKYRLPPDAYFNFQDMVKRINKS